MLAMQNAKDNALEISEFLTLQYRYRIGIMSSFIMPIVFVLMLSSSVLPREIRPLSPVWGQQGSPGDASIPILQELWHQTIVTRGFNHEGPRRGDVFVTSSFAKQIEPSLSLNENSVSSLLKCLKVLDARNAVQSAASRT
jgi:hypothetical protein